MVPRIATLDPPLPASLLAESEEAAREAARFDEHVGATFGTSAAGLSEIGPMSAILLRTESASSSQIENLTAGARQIALAELGEHANVNARLVRGNVHAMEAALRLSESIDQGSILAMHLALLGDSQPQRAGRWRDQQVWIGGSDAGPHRADFVPPHHEHVESAIADLVDFANRDDLPAVAQVAITHAQFETIHPFSDGNGRTGRALVHAMFAHRGLSKRITVPVSSGLLVNTGSYFEALGAYRRGDVAPIVERFNAATIFAVGAGRRLVDELKHVRVSFNDRVKARSDASAWNVADLLIAQPVINSAYIQSSLGISDVAALRAIETLEKGGVLVQPASAKRNRVWQSPEILSVLDDFAERIRRVRG
ncbi:Fic family protein [Aeromicrobium flavum]|uniref:Fic family protein n=1 Tax=Aeromicrobium flavum TaxID=416568 RepID=UPI001C99F52E|nr:Fic family protein [Aeromicrobium flavum]